MSLTIVQQKNQPFLVTKDFNNNVQAALNALPSTGGTVFVSPGTNTVPTGGLTIPNNNIRLTGAGPSSILFANVTGTDTTNIINVTSLNNIVIDNIALDGNKTNRTTSGIETQQNGIFFNGCSQCVVENVYAHDNPATGICMSSTTYSTFEDNVCFNNGRNGIYLNFSGNTFNVISGNVCENSRDFHGIACSNSSNNTISGNVCTGNAGSGIDLDGTSIYNVIQGNMLYNNAQSGLFLDTVVGFSANYCTIIGNVIEGNQQEGIRLKDAQYNTIVGNAITNNSQLAANTYDGIRLEAATTSASNNYIANNKISLNHKNGIEQVDTTCTGNIIVNNDTRGNTTKGIVMASGFTGVVRFNQGFVTEAHGNATITAAATSIVVTHGLAITPLLEQIQVTSQTTLGSAAFFWIDTVTSTQFTIHVNAVPGSSVVFGWKADTGY